MGDAEARSPPRPPRRPAAGRRLLHGVELADPYGWMENVRDLEVRQHIRAEKAYAKAQLSSCRDLRKVLECEMKARLAVVEDSPGFSSGGIHYWTRRRRDKPFALHLRRRESEGAPEEILLDEAELAEGSDYFRLEVFEVSPDHRFLLYGVDRQGGERVGLYVRDLRRGGEPLPISSDAAGTAAWSDSRTFYYSVLDREGRSSRLFRHRMGDDPQCDREVYRELDRAFHLSTGRSESGRFVLLALCSRSCDEVRLLDSQRPENGFKPIVARRAGLHYSVSHQGSRLFILANYPDQDHYQVFQAPAADPGLGRWELCAGPGEEGVIEDMRAFQAHLALLERRRGLWQIRVMESGSGRIRPVPLPEEPRTLEFCLRQDYRGSVLHFVYSSLTRPDAVVGFDMRRGRIRGSKPILQLRSHRLGEYESSRLWAPSPDGCEVPISIVRHRKVKADGDNPLLLHGYGAYGLCCDPCFSSPRLSLLERGWVFAIAHVRGGGEMGVPWHRAGRKLRKENSFNDFVACGEHLVERRWTRRERMAAQGESAGGLLLGAVANRRPGLFAAMAVHAPFVDVLHYLLDPGSPGAVADREEFGDPSNPEEFSRLLCYSPYENVSEQRYPAMLVTAGRHDSRVPCWGPVKWVARLRDHNSGPNPILLDIGSSGGHLRGGDRLQALRRAARTQAFLIDRLGVGAQTLT